MKKYEFMGEELDFEGRKLRRIRSLKDIPAHGVKAGDLGGFLEGEHNLSHKGDCWLGGEAKAWGRAKVYEDALACDHVELCGAASAYGSSKIFGYVLVAGASRVYGVAAIYDSVELSGDARVYGRVKLRGDFRVQGSAKIYGVGEFSGSGIVGSTEDYI